HAECECFPLRDVGGLAFLRSFWFLTAVCPAGCKLTSRNFLCRFRPACHSRLCVVNVCLPQLRFAPRVRRRCRHRLELSTTGCPRRRPLPRRSRSAARLLV